MSRVHRFAAVAATVCVAAAVLATAPPAAATTIGVGTEAAYRSAVGALSGDNTGAHTIFLTADITLTGVSSPTYTGTQQLRIDGNGHTLAATGNLSVLQSPSGGNPVIFDDITVTGGGAGNPAVLVNSRTVSVVDSVFTGNQSGGPGGAISSQSGSVQVTDSRFTANTSAGGGGGGAIYAPNGNVQVVRSLFAFNAANSGGFGGAIRAGGLTAVDSVFTDNTAVQGGQGGGVYASGSPTVTRSTFARNAAAGPGGGIYVGGNLTLDQSTITDNTASGGGGVRAGVVVATRSTLASNQANAGANVQSTNLTSTQSVFADPQGGGANCSITVPSASNGYNHATDSSCGLTGTGDVQNGADPELAPVAYNGGPTPTRLPAATSPLLDVIPNGSCGPTTDQRMLARPYPTGGACDVGAVERQGVGNGQIAFSTDRDGGMLGREIYTMAPDGTGQTNLTNANFNDIDPTWSPDGGRLAFRASRDNFDAEIYAMNADGTAQTNLTSNPGMDIAPAWSPNGDKIAFASRRDGGVEEIYVMNADGTSPARLTNDAGTDTAPTWSPDGTQLAFMSTRDGNAEIYTMNADGTSPVNRTNNSSSEDNPAWSPDGSRIAFRSTRDGNDEIYVMNADGTNPIRLTNDAASDDEPAWSPDGTRIAFSSYRDGNFEVYVMNADGTGQTNLTNDPGYDAWPDWQPVDTGDPTIRLDVPADGATYPNDTAATADYDCDDEGLGQFGCNGDVAPGSAFDLTVGVNTFTVDAVDHSGNTAQVTHTYTVVDVTDPVVEITTPPDEAVYDRGEVVNADYSCADEAGGSGIDTCVGDVADGDPIDTATLGDHTFSVTGTDNAGNETTVTHDYTVVDATGPSVEITTPPDGGFYDRDEVVDADYACTDEPGGSGIDTCVGDVADGDPIDTATAGAHDFTVVGTDNAANETTVTHTYYVNLDDRDLEAGDEAEYRDALAALSADGGGPKSITLTADIVLDDGGDPTYTGGQDLTVIGDGHAIDAGGTSRILDVDPTWGDPTVTFTDVTLMGGDAAAGAGGAVRSPGGVVVANATLTANHAAGQAGAVAADDLTLEHVTSAANTADGSAQQVLATTLTAHRSVLDGPDGDGPNCAIAGSTTSSHNWADDASCGLGGTGDTQDPDGDARLGPARDNGGGSPTMFPLWDSPLRDAIPNTACSTTLPTDQRGITRPFPDDGACDTGAVEAVYPPHAFTDSRPWAETAIRWITSTVNDPPLMAGFPNDTYRPNDPITRGQFARLLYREAGAPDISGLAPNTFDDVPNWLDDAVTWITSPTTQDPPIMVGFGDTFAPNAPITRAQVTRAKYRFAGEQPTTGYTPNGFTDVPNWVDQAVDWATHHGLMTGYDNNTFRPDNDITRGAVARLDERLGLSPWAWNNPDTAPNTLPFRPD